MSHNNRPPGWHFNGRYLILKFIISKSASSICDVYSLWCNKISTLLTDAMQRGNLYQLSEHISDAITGYNIL